MKFMKVAVVMPARNEEKRIPRTLEAFLSYFKKIKKQGIDCELIVVLNACTDNTLGAVKKFSKNKQLRILNFKQGGKGFAILEGFKDALKRENAFIGFVDADLATSPEAYYDLIKGIKEYDGAIASRGVEGAVVKTNLTRGITHKGFNFLVRSILFLNFKDTQCGAKLFKRKAVEQVIDEIGLTQWAFDIDLLYRIKKKGFKIKEIPTTWNNIEGSKINLIKTPFKMFSGIMRLRLKNSPFKFVVRAYDLLPEKIKMRHY